MYQSGVLLHDTHPPAKRFIDSRGNRTEPPPRTDAHIITLFQRLGATRSAGTLTLPLEVMRQSYRYLGLTPAEMDVCLRPLLLVGRTQVSLLEFTRILQAADPYQRAHAGDGSGVEDRTRAPGATTSVPSAKLYTYPPHPPQQLPSERGSSARPASSRRSPNRISVISPPGTKGYDEVVTRNSEGVRLYSAELQRLCDIGTFDDGHPSRQALASASNLRSISVDRIAGLAISQMERDRQREENKTRRLVEVEDLMRARASPTSPRPNQGITAAVRPDPALPDGAKPRAPMVPRCAAQVPDRYTSDRAKRIQQDRLEGKSPERRRSSPARKHSPQSARRPPSATRNNQHHRPTTPRTHSRQSQRSPSPGMGHHASTKQQPLMMMTEDPRLLVHEEEYIQVDAVTVKSSKAFRLQRQLDSIVFLQCQLRSCQSVLLRDVLLPSLRRLRRVGKGYLARRKLCELRQHLALRPLLHQAQLHHKPSVHAVYRMAPLPKAEPTDPNVARAEDPRPPATAPTTASSPRSPIILVPVAPSAKSGAPSKRSVRTNNNNSASGSNNKPSQSASATAPLSPKSSTASNTALLRKSQQVVVKDKAARVITRFIRLAAARHKRARLARNVLWDMAYQQRQDNAQLIQSFARINATRYRYEYALRIHKRRSAAKVIQGWWRMVLVKLRLRDRQRHLAQEVDWRVRLERYRDVALRCGLWWRGIKARARYAVKQKALARYQENRVAIEKRNDAKYIIARAARWFVCRRRHARQLAKLQQHINDRVREEARIDAAKIIQKYARPWLCRRLVARRQRALQVRLARREANESVQHARCTVQSYFEGVVVLRNLLPLKRSAFAMRCVIVSQSAVRRRQARNRVRALRTALEVVLTESNRRRDAQLVVAMIKAAASLNVARNRLAKAAIKQVIEAGVATAESDAAAAAAAPTRGLGRKDSSLVGSSSGTAGAKSAAAAPPPKLTKTTSTLRR